ncbi:MULTISPECIES: acetate--CoA ligase [unclassified Acidiplasma]|nr:MULTISPECIES: acetate--CoA ligase [unclassified Acidiplasma]KJE49202.1 3-hydroxypropionyl-CoA synthetase [Acidiplasma sp. MBA-1]WMT54842.1 MAG: acetate--CoA ligase [Acidiplasma sp.]
MNDTLPMNERYSAHLSRYFETYKKSLENPDEFWNEHASIIDWFSPYTKVLDDSKKPFYRWFINGKTNMSYNCLDRHINTYKRNKVAFIWVSESGNEKVVTYYGLYKRVNAFARALLNLGIKRGDNVTIYLPMILEAPVAMLACARIGAVFNVVFSGFGEEALAQRINDSRSKTVITADGAYRKGKLIDLKNIVDRAADLSTGIDNVIVVRNANNKISMVSDRDYYYDEILEDSYVEPERMDSNDPLFILYTSGTTGKPKGIVHGNGGYPVWVANTLKWAFDPKDEDRWWCAADIGWITGHSYIVFAPLLLGLTSIIYEGAIDYPKPDRMWEIIERYGVNILYTSPTAIRLLMKYGEKYPESHDLSTLKALGTVGEPINPAAWHWYYEVIGKNRCPIIDTYWQTETGGFTIAPSIYLGLPDLKPGSATFPMPGIEPDVLDENGKRVRDGEKGYMVIKRPWPGMMLTVNGDDQRYIDVYFSKFKNIYLMGDYAIRDSDGYYWLLGRSDEVLKVSGHRIGTIEIEDELVSMKEIAEAAVFGKPDTVKGDAIIAFVTLKDGYEKSSELIEKIKRKVRNDLGPIMVPEEIHIVNSLPKTRSGKIMRRVIKAVYLNQLPGDISTLENEASVDEIKRAMDLIKKQSGN